MMQKLIEHDYVAHRFTSSCLYSCLFAHSGVQHIIYYVVVLFDFLHLVYPMLPVSLDCPFSIVLSIFFNFYLKSSIQKIYGLHHERVDRSDIFNEAFSLWWRFPLLLTKFRSRFLFSSLSKWYWWNYGILYKISLYSDNCTISKRILFSMKWTNLHC